MKISQNEEPGGTCLRIEGGLEIGIVEELHKELLELLQQPGALIVDLSGVEACDCAVLQLLYAAQRSADAAGISFRVQGQASAISDLIARLGLRDFAQETHDGGDRRNENISHPEAGR